MLSSTAGESLEQLIGVEEAVARRMCTSRIFLRLAEAAANAPCRARPQRPRRPRRVPPCPFVQVLAGIQHVGTE